MAREITEVWVVRGAVGNVIAHVETEAEAATWRFGGNTIERLPLLTPHDAAVLEAAEAWEFAFRDPSDPWGYTVDAKQDELIKAVRALRAVRGEP
jgi:hypothetical protein